MQQLHKSFGFGVDEDTGLYINKGVATVVGNSGVWILDISLANYMPETYFRMDDVRVHYLTEGDSFDLETNVLNTNKSVLIPNTEQLYQSEDIFGPDEGVKSIVSLVSSDSFVENEGQSYDVDPIAAVVFRKESSTKAFVSREKYAIYDLFMDISTI